MANVLTEETVRIPGAGPKHRRYALTESEVVCVAPDTTPSARPSRTAREAGSKMRGSFSTRSGLTQAFPAWMTQVCTTWGSSMSITRAMLPPPRRNSTGLMYLRFTN